MVKSRKRRQSKRPSSAIIELINSDDELTIDKTELKRRDKKHKQRIKDYIELLALREKDLSPSTPVSIPVSAPAAISYDYTEYDGQYYGDEMDVIPKTSRNDYWRDQSKVLIDCFSRGHNIHGHADPCLKFPVLVNTKPADCDCEVRSTSGYINGFMMFCRCSFQVEYCKHQTLLESLLISQMLPTSTKQPKSAVHFSIFESLNDNCLNVNSSVYGFTKANNATNARLSNYDVDFKPLPSNFNEMAVIYNRTKKHSLEDLYKVVDVKK